MPWPICAIQAVYHCIWWPTGLYNYESDASISLCYSKCNNYKNEWMHKINISYRIYMYTHEQICISEVFTHITEEYSWCNTE